MATLSGYRRPDGSLGARNHILILPSVVCAGQTATLIGEAGAVAVVHQHGCGQVGEDEAHTERAFIGFATNPNVGACLVVSLGCETIQGARLADRIRQRGQRVEFAGIQLLGGTFNTVESGRAAVTELQGQLAELPRSGGGLEDLRVGIETSALTQSRAMALANFLTGAGIAWVVAQPEEGPAGAGERLRYGERAKTPAAVVEHAGEGAEQHVGLAGAGAQVIVSLRAGWQAPLGNAVAPVIAVAGDPELHAALADDFDAGPEASPEQLLEQVIGAFNGEPTAAERRGARDFVVRRVARTM